MCGIAGILSQDGSLHEGQRRAVEHMLGLLAHRGPDDAGVFLAPSLGMGAVRLAILDPAEGRQPYASEDGRVVAVFNGEIYNAPGLRADLERRGHRLCSRTDGEVIVHLYEEHGPAFLRQLEGMFALALWDERRRELLLARDPVGIKPLYLWQAQGTVAFASEAKAFFALPGFLPAVQAELIPAYLAFRFVPGPHTLWPSVTKLSPGTYLRLRPGREPVAGGFARPWPALGAYSMEEAAEHVREVLREAVRSQLASDVPWGVFLSGGLDSAGVTALAREASAGPLLTFSLGFRVPGAEDEEFAAAARMAQEVGAEHHEIVVSHVDLAERLQRLALVLDEPVADPTALSLDLLAEAAAAKVRMVLTGEGADELFAGYPLYRQPQALAPLERIPAPLLRGASRVLSRLWGPHAPGRALLSRLQHPAHLRYFGAGQSFAPWEIEELVAPELLQQAGEKGHAPLQVLERLMAGVRTGHAVDDMLRLDLMTWLPDDVLLKVDRVTMSYGLEARVPYLDTRVLHTALALPASLKLARGGDKQVLRRALSPVLPPGWEHRPKRGFPAPITRLLTGPLREFAYDVLRSAPARERGYYRAGAVDAWLQAMDRGRPGAARRVFTLLVLELWAEAFTQAQRAMPEPQRALAGGRPPRVRTVAKDV